MRITPERIHNVLRVYGAQLIADREKREIEIKKKKKRSKKKLDQSGCVRSAPCKGNIDIYK
ncbi:hypothetical protein LCGC14_2582340 [marine sediment metagenome]|uniref:Uncharacterized protein n=1 Tax=marine sediment metagenome TaxID=412755 RepID=A0A0F9B217_9ZZZZ